MMINRSSVSLKDRKSNMQIFRAQSRFLVEHKDPLDLRHVGSKDKLSSNTLGISSQNSHFQRIIEIIFNNKTSK